MNCQHLSRVEESNGANPFRLESLCLTEAMDQDLWAQCWPWLDQIEREATVRTREVREVVDFAKLEVHASQPEEIRSPIADHSQVRSKCLGLALDQCFNEARRLLMAAILNRLPRETKANEEIPEGLELAELRKVATLDELDFLAAKRRTRPKARKSPRRALALSELGNELLRLVECGELSGMAAVEAEGLATKLEPGRRILWIDVPSDQIGEGISSTPAVERCSVPYAHFGAISALHSMVKVVSHHAGIAERDALVWLLHRTPPRPLTAVLEYDSSPRYPSQHRFRFNVAAYAPRGQVIPEIQRFVRTHTKMPLVRGNARVGVDCLDATLQLIAREQIELETTDWEEAYDRYRTGLAAARKAGEPFGSLMNSEERNPKASPKSRKRLSKGFGTATQDPMDAVDRRASRKERIAWFRQRTVRAWAHALGFRFRDVSQLLADPAIQLRVPRKP